MDSEMKKFLIILGFQEDIQEVPKMKTVLKMWRKAARLCHPDKGGNKEEFQKVQDAYEKVGEMINDSTKYDQKDDDEEEAFARKVFEEFNSKKENSNSFTIKIENKRSVDWDSTFTSLYGESVIPNQNESNGRHWYHQGYSIDGISSKISITLWTTNQSL